MGDPTATGENVALSCRVHGGYSTDRTEDCSERRRMDSGFAYIRCVYQQPAEDQR